MVQTLEEGSPLNIEGNFDLAVIGVPSGTGRNVQIQRSLGADTTNWVTFKVVSGQVSEFVANVGNNSFRLFEDVDGVDVTINQV